MSMTNTNRNYGIQLAKALKMESYAIYDYGMIFNLENGYGMDFNPNDSIENQMKEYEKIVKTTDPISYTDIVDLHGYPDFKN